MQDLEPPTRPEGNGDDSSLRSDAGSDFDDGHERDVVEDFARRLDQIVLQQSGTTWAHSDDDSDENDTELFGYEQLPQEEDDDQLSESSEIDTDPIRVPIQYDTTEDTDISKDQAEYIKNIMSKIQLPKPEWAKQISEDQWLPQRKK